MTDTTKNPPTMILASALTALMSEREFTLDEIVALADDIREHGMINPIQVVTDLDNPGRYFIASGNRRHAAAVILGWSEVPCEIVTDCPADLSLRDNAREW